MDLQTCSAQLVHGNERLTLQLLGAVSQLEVNPPADAWSLGCNTRVNTQSDALFLH